MNKTFRTGIAGLALAVSLTAPAAAATVTVRVEGATTTLVSETPVTTSPEVVVDKTAEGGTTCAGTSGGAALELATRGDWGGRSDAQGQRVERIGAETYLLGAEFGDKYWALYVNNVPASVGLCAYTPQTGDEVLLTAACAGATTGCGGDPLDVRAPATAAPGVPFPVQVDGYTSDFSGPAPTAAKAPAAGATVTGGDVPVATGSDGKATVTVTRRGPVRLVAEATQESFGQTIPRTRDSAPVCVTDGADGFCGTTRPGDAAPPAAPCATTGEDGRCGTRDRRPPQVTITGIREGQRFSRSRAPRELTAAIAEDPSGLHAVKLGLSRRHEGRCSVLSGKRERFRRTRCGRHPVFVLGDRAEVSYLLPRRLPRGRYVLDVVAIDKAFNRDPLARGRNRVVFTVR